jgi:hypothetical protein
MGLEMSSSLTLASAWSGPLNLLSKFNIYNSNQINDFRPHSRQSKPFKYFNLNPLQPESAVGCTSIKVTC